MKQKSSPVERQKGPIRPDMPTMKTITPQAQALEDALMQKDRRAGQILTYHEPKR